MAVRKSKKISQKPASKAPEAKKPTPGVYVYKPIKSKIIECDCGNKYIATRPRQRTCLDCVKGQSLATSR